MSIRTLLLATAAVAAVGAFTESPAFAQVQSTIQQKCLNMVNRDGVVLGGERSKANSDCVKRAGMGQLPGTAQSCLTADPKSKILKKQTKTITDASKFCQSPPSFGYVSAAAVNAGVLQGELDIAGDVFGPDLDSAIVACSASKTGCTCQQKVFFHVGKLADAKLVAFANCKKAVLKDGAASAASLRACVEDANQEGSIAADSTGKIHKRRADVNISITRKCDLHGVTATSFPGDCSGLTGPELGACIDVQVECRVCQMINDMDGLLVNCDQFDDGNENGSCASGTGPTPTPSPTPIAPPPTPTPTPAFQPGAVVQGILPPTSGRFNFNLVPGLPGADAACSASFAGTHACTFPELLIAEAAGDLDGARDVNGTTVTAFWAIDGTLPDAVQCRQTIAWDYSGTDPLLGGAASTLNNLAGTLGPVTPGLICGALRWVGCCL